MRHIISFTLFTFLSALAFADDGIVFEDVKVVMERDKSGFKGYAPDPKARTTGITGTRDPRVVGGSSTTIDQWPWQVAVDLNPALFAGNGFDRQFCGGTLITPTLVITAAHCVHDGNAFTDPHLYSVITGRTDLSTNLGQELAFDTYYVPTDPATGLPVYDPFSGEFDFVLVSLVSASVSQTIKIAGPDEGALWEHGRVAFVTGWGTTQESLPDYQSILRVGQVTMVDDNECANTYASEGVGIFPATMVCAAAHGVDSCQGDSGGPLVVPILGGGFRLVGDTSFGIGCARDAFPGVYGRLADRVLFFYLNDFVLNLTGISVFGQGAQPFGFVDTNGAPIICKGRAATIVGTAGNDVLIGTPGPDVISGLDGDDRIRGLGGNDIICGNAGKDRLFGGAGRDKLIGGPGKDFCNGGSGRDQAACEVKVGIP